MSETAEFFRHLRGDVVDQGDPHLQTCAQMIREAMDHPAFYQPAPLTPEKLEVFRDKLRQSSSISAPNERVLTSRFADFAKWTLPLAASLLIGVGVIRLATELNQNESASIQVASRSVEVRDVKLVNDPTSTVKALQLRLKELGIDSTVESQHGIWRLEAFVPAENEAEVNQLIAEHQRVVGQNGALVLEFKKP